MKVAVRYHSRGGKTKKLAEAVAQALNVEAKAVSEPLKEDVDILFLCTAPYAFDVDSEVKAFIGGINVSVGKVVLMSTSAMLKSIRKYVEKPFGEKNIPIASAEFSCRGEFMIAHKGRPNEADLKAAVEFARKIAG